MSDRLLGRLVVLLFSEPLDPTTANDLANYAIDGHRLGDVLLQPSTRTGFITQGIGDNRTITSVELRPRGRLAMLFLREPLRPPPDPPGNSPFIPRMATVNAVTDLRGLSFTTGPQTLPIQEDPLLGAGGLLSGTVRRADGSPVPFALVNYQQRMCPISSPNCPVRPITISQVTASAQGEYHLEFVLHNLYGPFTVTGIDPETGERGSVTGAVRFNGQRLELDVILPGFGSLEGTVRDAQGNPVPGAIITVQSLVTGQTSVKSGAVADGVGQFRIARMPVGNVAVEAVSPDGAATGKAAATIPSVGATGQVDVTVFAFTGSVRARVVQHDGVTPVQGIPIIVEIFGKSRPIALHNSDGNGSALFSDLPVGLLIVRTLDIVTGEETFVRVSNQPNQTTDVTLVLPGSGGTIRGRVVDGHGQPLPLVQVVAGLFSTVTDSLGEFEISGLVVGNVTVKAGDPVTGSQTEQTVTLTSPDDVQEITLVLPSPPDSITVQGTVFQADTVTPIPHVPVYLLSTGGVVAVETDEFGQSIFPNVPAFLPQQVIVRSTNGTFDGGEIRTSFTFNLKTAVERWIVGSHPRVLATHATELGLSGGGRLNGSVDLHEDSERQAPTDC